MTTSSATFSVSGMNCAHCVSAVTRAVQQAGAGANVQVDLSKQIVAVTSGINTDVAKAVIEQANYLVKSPGRTGRWQRRRRAAVARLSVDVETAQKR